MPLFPSPDVFGGAGHDFFFPPPPFPPSSPPSRPAAPILCSPIGLICPPHSPPPIFPFPFRPSRMQSPAAAQLWPHLQPPSHSSIAFIPMHFPPFQHFPFLILVHPKPVHPPPFSPFIPLYLPPLSSPNSIHFPCPLLQMGCLFKCLDPGPPDESVRHFWHIRGLILDAVAGNCASAQPGTSSSQLRHQPHSPSADTLQVQEGANAAGGGQSNGSNGRQRRSKKEGEKERGAGGREQLIPRQNVQRLPPGVLYIYEGRLVYRSRRWARCPWPSGGNGAEELTVELCQIGDVNVAQQFISQRDEKPIRCQGPLVEVQVTGRQPPLHLAFLTAQAEAVGEELREIFLRHRHRPRIFQFNSIDVDGIEIEVP